MDTVSIAGSWDVQTALEWNNSDLKVVDSCIHQLIEKQAHLHPDNLSVDAWDGQLTYKELDQAANRFAHLLVVDYGVQTGDLIPVCFEKSVWFTVAILGINKAGGAWVPIDPSHPQLRHQQVVQQTGAKIAVASLTSADICHDLVPHVITLCEALDTRLTRRSKEWSMRPPTVNITPSSAAYVLFTSGTTGIPKGVVMQHRSVCTSQIAIARRLNITPDVRLLQFSAYVFDVSVGEIIGSLVSGACVCVPSEHDRMNGLRQFINAMDVNWAYLTPTFARTLKPADLPSLKLLLLAGEAVSKDVFEMWFGKVRLVNGWGPAETCVFSAMHEWKSIRQSPLTIGRPVGGLCWIVDPQDPQRLAPLGCIGEVVVQGPTLLREYLSDPAQTEGATVTTLPDWAPNRTSANWSRFYKTGDLGFYNMDGTVEYVGRKDTQIKIRGLRVELGAVEQQIRDTLTGVRDVAVDVLKTNTGSNLIAYLSFSESKGAGQSFTEDTLLPLTSDLESQITSMLGKLRVSLPRYMIPALFIPCSYLPVITSGKLDRKGLRNLTASLGADKLAKYALVGGKKRAPKTTMEIHLRAIWSQVLNIPLESIGRDDSFMVLGGDSITAIQFVTTLRDQGMVITVNDIFTDPRLSAVATKIIDAENELDYTAAPFSILPSNEVDTVKAAIRDQCDISSEQEIEDAYPCTGLQEGLMALAVKQPGSYVAKYVYRLPRHINPSRFKSAWDRTVQLCPILRTRIVTVDGASIQAVIPENAKWEDTDGMDLRSVMNKAKTIEMDYGSRLSRYAFVTDDKTNEQYFALIIHHTVFDGWSLNVLLGTLISFYRGEAPPTLQPYSSFVNYTAQLDPAVAAAYWTQQLEGAQRATFPRAITTPGYKPVSRVMKTSMPFPMLMDNSITKATILRAAWAVVLARYCDTKDVCFGTSVSGRQAPIAGINLMAGPAVATVPVRVRLDSQKGVSSFLKDIQQQAVEMVPHEQFGLRNISKLSINAKEACDFSSLMVIQPMQQLAASAEDPDAVLLATDPEAYGVEEATEGYFSYPLVLQCLVYDEKVDLVMSYDSGVLNETQLRGVAQHLTQAIQQLLKKRVKSAKSLSHKSSSRSLSHKSSSKSLKHKSSSKSLARKASSQALPPLPGGA